MDGAARIGQVLDLTAPGAASPQRGDAVAVPEPTDGPGNGLVVALALPGSDGDAFVDLLAVLTDADRMQGSDPVPVTRGQHCLASLAWDADVPAQIERLRSCFPRIRALTMSPLDLRAGVLVEHRNDLARARRVGDPATMDLGEIDWRQVERLHRWAHAARDAWYDVVDRAGIATIDLYSEHWHDVPLEVASMVCRWLGQPVPAHVDDGLAALFTAPAVENVAVATAAAEQVECDDCDASLASADRLTRLETYALANTQVDPA